MTPPERLKATVLDGDYCIGCGACAALAPGMMDMGFDSYGEIKATVHRSSDSERVPDVEAVCPFSAAAVDETTLGRALYGDAGHHDEQLGFYRRLYVGHVTAGGYRARGSAGGTTSWLLARALESGRIDGVLHVREAVAGGFAYTLSTTAEEVRQGSKSRYYPIEMASVLAIVRSRPGHYAIVGVPCFIKAVRLLQQQLPEIAQRIVLTVALVCGHLKSRHYADFLAWQCGVPPGGLGTIDFRHKLADQPASRYAVRVVERHGTAVVKPMNQMFGTNWGYGLFKYRACDFCDDVMGETADVAFGDAWVAPYQNDPAGTNVIVVRSAAALHLLLEGRDAGDLALDEVAPAVVVSSQASGLRHRRLGLGYRLGLMRAEGRWHPVKRVAARSWDGSRYARMQRVRIRLRETCRTTFLEARERQDFGLLERQLGALIRKHERLAVPLAERLSRTWAGHLAGLLPAPVKRLIRAVLPR